MTPLTARERNILDETLHDADGFRQEAKRLLEMRNRRNQHAPLKHSDFEDMLQKTYGIPRSGAIVRRSSEEHFEEEDLELTCAQECIPEESKVSRYTATSRKRSKKDILLLDKSVNRRVRRDLSSMFFNRRDLGYGVKEWPDMHNWKLLESHPIYGMKNVSSKYSTNTCMHCDKGRPRHWCQECTLLHLYPVTVCRKCREVHERLMNEASSEPL